MAVSHGVEFRGYVQLQSALRSEIALVHRGGHVRRCVRHHREAERLVTPNPHAAAGS